MKVKYKPYTYLKADPFAPPKQSMRAGTKLFAITLVLFGIGILVSVALPIVGWQLTSSSPEQLVNPAPQHQAVLGAATNRQTVSVKKLADGFSYFSVDGDTQNLRQGTFTLEIPKIGIKNALVIANTNNFDTHLGHLPGSAFPGEVGNVFISGHSALPAFYSPTNYKTIFTYIPKLDVLDTINIYMGNRLYQYSVEKKTIVDPSDVSVIYPPDPFGKYLTLMTCVPPGTNSKRLIVLARLVE